MYDPSLTSQRLHNPFYTPFTRLRVFIPLCMLYVCCWYEVHMLSAYMSNTPENVTRCGHKATIRPAARAKLRLNQNRASRIVRNTVSVPSITCAASANRIHVSVSYPSTVSPPGPGRNGNSECPATRIVSLTVTEHGYCLNRSTKKLDPAHALIKADLAHPDRPSSAIGTSGMST